MLQAEKSQVLFPMRSLDFFNRPNPFSRTMALGSTKPLTEVNTGNLPGSKGLQARKADLTSSVSCGLENMGASTSHNHIGLHSLLQG
jgi:hypothetical protein